MPSDIDAKLIAVIEERVKAQLDRHRSIDPNADPKKIVELTIRMQKEGLKQKLDKLLESEEFGVDEEMRELSLRRLIDEVLPEVERILKMRY